MNDLRNQLIRSVAETGAHLRLVQPERTLPDVLRDISEAGPIVWDGRSEWNALSHEQKDAALDRLDDLQAEARRMIEAATGVSWNAIQEACL